MSRINVSSLILTTKKRLITIELDLANGISESSEAQNSTSSTSSYNCLLTRRDFYQSLTGHIFWIILTRNR